MTHTWIYVGYMVYLRELADDIRIQMFLCQTNFMSLLRKALLMKHHTGLYFVANFTVNKVTLPVWYN